MYWQLLQMLEIWYTAAAAGADVSSIYLESFSFSPLYHRIHAHSSPQLPYRNSRGKRVSDHLSVPILQHKIAAKGVDRLAKYYDAIDDMPKCIKTVIDQRGECAKK